MPKDENTKEVKTKTEKIVNFLGGPSAVAGELGLEGILQLYDLLNIPLPFADGGAVGSPPIYETNKPKEAIKTIIDATLGSGIESIPIYQNPNFSANFSMGVGSSRPFDYGLGFQYGDFGGGVQMYEGKPSFGIGYRKEFAEGGTASLKNIMGGDYEYTSPTGKNYDYDLIRSLPGTPGAAAKKFGREAIYGTTVNAGDNDITTPGKYTSYYDLVGVGGDAASPALKQEYRFIQEDILKPENLVRDYGLEGAKKILAPYIKAATTKSGTAGGSAVVSTPTTTSMAGKELRSSVVEQLKRLGFISSDEDLARILGSYGVLSLKDGGLTSTVPPERGPNSQGLATLFQKR